MSDEINKKITADASQANREFVKVSNEVEKLKQQLAKLHRSSKEGSDQMVDALKSQTQFIKQGVTDFFTLKSAVGFVTSAYGEFRNEIHALGEASSQLNKEMQKSLTMAGDLANRERDEAFIKTAPRALGLTREQALAAFNAADDAKVDDKMMYALIREAAPLAPAFGSDKDALGRLVGTAGGLTRAMPGLSANDATDVALLFQQQAGKDTEALTEHSFLQSVRAMSKSGAMNSDDALGAGLVGLEHDLPTKFITKLAGALTEKFDVADPVRGKEDSAEDQVKRRLNGMAANEKLAYLQANPEAASAIFGATDALKFSEIGQGAFARKGEEIRQAREGNYALNQAGLANPDRIEGQRTAANLDASLEWKEKLGRQELGTDKRMETIRNNSETNWLRTAEEKLFYNTSLGIRRLIGQENADLEAEWETGWLFGNPEYEKDAQATEARRQKSEVKKSSEPGELQETNQLLREQNDLIRSVAGRAPAALAANARGRQNE